MNLHEKDHLSWAHPLVKKWFYEKFGSPTAPQIQGWPSILENKTTLISAPTGSGKTLAAFLTCIDRLVREALDNSLPSKTSVLYISPLKALSNDIQKNLLVPLNEITELANQENINLPEIKVSVRTGDTLAYERQAMLKSPPHILITTPESFFILLTAEKSRAILTDIKTIIIDEIHALSNDKRGSHLILSLERLNALTKKSATRIGLSATQKPLDLVAKFLNGNKKITPRIINIGHKKNLELAIEVPKRELEAVASNELWDEIYDRVAELAHQNRSTLVFVNTRKLAERVAHHLRERLGEEKVAAHHGSLSRKIRLDVETKLKNGALQVLVATASLELGIDIGVVDLVCQIGSTRSISVALQRIGRSGHAFSAISKGRFFVTTRDELLECAALLYTIKIGELDELIIPEEPLDILTQQIIATCATDDWNEDKLYELCKKAYSYKNLTREKFNSIIEILAEGIAASRGRYSAYLFRDRINNRVKARRGSRLTAITSGGAIPENGLFSVITESEGTLVGTLDEDFAVESNRGDIILLGSTSWQIKRVENKTGKVFVEDAKGAPPSVPFWRGEAPTRSNELSYYVSWLREKLDLMMEDSEESYKWLNENCGLNEYGSKQLLKYVKNGKKVLNAVPTQTTIIAERFFDEAGGMQLVIHAPFGARINKAWGLALRKRFCKSFNFELQATATDDGINISLSEQHSFPLDDVFKFLHSNTIEEVLIQAILQSPLFTTRWRWVATRALALVRFRYGKKVPPNILRMLSDDLLAAVFPDAAACQDNLQGKIISLPDHPLINECMKEILHDALDINGFKKLISDIENEKVTCIAIDTSEPSVFSHQILNANPYAYLDDAPLEERRARAVEMRRTLPETQRELGKLDQDAILEIQSQAIPDIRNGDELHDLLQTLVAIPINIKDICKSFHTEKWQTYLDELIKTGRVGIAKYASQEFWVCVETKYKFLKIYPNGIFLTELQDLPSPEISNEDALLSMVKGWLLHLGPVSNLQLKDILHLSISEIEQALLKLESIGFILRGKFNSAAESLEWCERRLLAKIHRLTLAKLRKEIEPVSPIIFMQWLLKWQHLLPGSELCGQEGLLEIIKQLQGYEAPAKFWEQQIFSKRIKNYKKDFLDYLCLSGQVGWGRISLHSSLSNNTASKKRIIPTSIAPITFFLREEVNSIITFKNITENNPTNLSFVAESIYHYLKEHGPSFFSDISLSINKLKSELEMGLWELVAAGIITADGFDNLRALLDSKRRLGKNGRKNRPRFSMGRWSLLKNKHNLHINQQITDICWMLLKRYGIVFRDLISKEKNLPSWKDLLKEFRCLEHRGEIRGGLFVKGFYGEQFALPYALESLRAMRSKKNVSNPISISAYDPLNLSGIILSKDNISVIPGKKIILNLEFMRDKNAECK